MQSRKDNINSKDVTGRFLSSLFDSSVVTNSRKSVYLGSLIDRGCGILVRELEKISKTNRRGGWNSREGWERVNILIAKGRVGF